MKIRQVLLPFALGVAVGVALHKYWPTIREKGGPLVKNALKGGTELAARARETLHERSEKFADLIAEIREEDEARAKSPAPPPSEA